MKKINILYVSMALVMWGVAIRKHSLVLGCISYLYTAAELSDYITEKLAMLGLYPGARARAVLMWPIGIVMAIVAARQEIKK